MKFIAKNRVVFFNVGISILFPFLFFVTILIKKRRDTIIWGPEPLLNYKYWSNAVKPIRRSVTLARKNFKINSKSDFDLLYEDLIPRFFPKNKLLFSFLGPVLGYIYTLSNAYSINTSFRGAHFSNSIFWNLELSIYKFYGIKIIIQPYGSDIWMYSKIWDNILKHGLLLSYPNAAFKEKLISEKIHQISKLADIVIPCLITYGVPFWNCLPVNMLCIDEKIILNRTKKKSKKLKIVHAPNHRGFKGTEFILNTINILRKEGYNFEFELLENKNNVEVLDVLENSHVLIEQLNFNGYALNAIEAMAKGMVVLSNLDDHRHNLLFRNYSFLNECPILSTTHENLKENLIELLTNHELRNNLGKLGIEYVKKYHSYTSAQYMFSNIFKKLEGEDIDLMNLYHPLKSEYVKTNYIHTPLKNNKYVGQAR